METGAIITAVAALFIKSETNIVKTRITTKTQATLTPDKLVVNVICANCSKAGTR